MNEICQSISSQIPDHLVDGMVMLDCVSSNAVETAFARLFGSEGVLTPVLTILLTLYVAWIAFKMISGRSISLSLLSPQILKIGFILTLATSWSAYQTLVLDIAWGAADEIAAILLQTEGSATLIFADRLDVIFESILSQATSGQSSNQEGNIIETPFLLWCAAALLLFSTVGVLIIGKLVIAVLLCIGPLFIILTLFTATKGLFIGWLRAVVLFTILPLIAILLGYASLAYIGPMTQTVASLGGNDLNQASNILFAALIHATLMFIAAKAAAMLVSGWQSGGDRDQASAPSFEASAANTAQQGTNDNTHQGSQSEKNNDRVQMLIAAIGQYSQDRSFPQGHSPQSHPNNDQHIRVDVTNNRGSKNQLKDKQPRRLTEFRTPKTNIKRRFTK